MVKFKPEQGHQLHSPEIRHSHLSGKEKGIRAIKMKSNIATNKIKNPYLTFRTFLMFCNIRGIFSGDTADRTNICLTSQLICLSQYMGSLTKFGQKTNIQEQGML